MATVDQLITRFVYQHGEISLQGIGSIKLLDAIPDSEYLQKHKLTPIQGLEFVHQKTAQTTPAFVKFYAEQRGKIASLAENDVEAYLSMASQFLNIGNPVELKGLGTIAKQKDGTLVMNPGYFIAAKDDGPAPKFRERHQKTAADYAAEKEAEEQTEQRNKTLRGVLIVLAALAVLAIGWWIYKSGGMNADTDTATTVEDTGLSANDLSTDTSALRPLVPDTSVQSTPNSNTAALPVAGADTSTLYNWKAVVLKISSRRRADSLYNAKYKSYAMPMELDSLNGVYRIVTRFQARTVDTAAKKQYYQTFFARSVGIEPVQ
jgi:hypothetical protein